MDKATGNLILTKVMETGEKVEKLAVTIDNHHHMIVETRNDVKTVVSKQNQDMMYYIEDREKTLKEQNLRIDPMWDEYEKRTKLVADVKVKTWNIVWDWAKVALIFGASYMMTSIYEVFKLIKK